MEEYKPNSHKSKEEQKNLVPEKRVEKVISGTVKSRKNQKCRSLQTYSFLKMSIT